MRQAGISGLVRRKRGRTTIRVPGVRVADDLVERQFLPDAPNLLWIADLTYLRTWEGWLYLAAVQDAYSRAIVGWSMAEHMRAELVVDALEMAVARRRPDPGLIHHSDQGSQYVSLAFGQAARRRRSRAAVGGPPPACTLGRPHHDGNRDSQRAGRGNIRGNIQIVHYVHCVQIRRRSGRYGRIGRI
jgi:putative transposase